MTNRVAGKIKLQSVDQLLGVPEISGTQEIEIVRIHAFPNHPFKVLDDERMDMLVDSIREKYGMDAIQRAAFLKQTRVDHMNGGISREKRTVDYKNEKVM